VGLILPLLQTMKNLRLIIALVVLLAFVGICLIGCGSPTVKLPEPKDFEGKWVAIKKEAYALGGAHQVGFVIEFFNDKTVALPAGKGNWEILKDGRIKIELSGIIMHGLVQQNILTLTMADNKGKVIFKKQ
jgi:hypothetical protein